MKCLVLSMLISFILTSCVSMDSPEVNNSEDISQTTSIEKTNQFKKHGTADQCCTMWMADGSCSQEIIPGCATEASKADTCCAHWTADGTCAHELIPGCSK